MMAGQYSAKSKLVIAGLFLCYLLVACESRHIQHRSANESDAEDLEGIDSTDLVVKVADNEVGRFLNNSRSKFIEALKNLSNYLPINVEYALMKECDIIHNNRVFYARVPLIISAALIVLGIIFGYFGYRLMKIVLFLIGFLIGFAISYFIIVAFTHSRPEHWIPYVALAVATVVGLITGLLTICIYYIGIFLAGGSIGFLISWFILASINVPFFRNHIYVPIIIAVVAAIVVGIFSLFLQKWFFMLGTAILGGFIVVWGLDYYLELGSMIYYLFLFAENRSSLKPCWYSWIILPIFMILIIAGFLIQVFVTGRKYDHKKEMKGVCCGLCSRKKKDMKDAPDGKAKYMKLKPVSEKEEKH